MRLFRAVSHAEIVDIQTIGKLRPGPPSFQGKWFAESVGDAAIWGRFLFEFLQEPFHVLEIELPSNDADAWFRLDYLDRIGPGRFAEPDQLASIISFVELAEIPLGIP